MSKSSGKAASGQQRSSNHVEAPGCGIDLVPCQDADRLAQPGWPEWILPDQLIDLAGIIRVDNPDAAGTLSARRFQRPRHVDLAGVALKKRQVLGHVIAPDVCPRIRMILEQDDELHAQLLACPRQIMRLQECELKARYCDVKLQECSSRT